MRMLNSEDSSKKSWIILGVAFVLAGGAAWLSSYYLDYQEEMIKSSLVDKNSDKIAIVVPRVSVKPGDVISGANMVVREIPRKYLPDGVFQPGQFKSLEGRTITSHISPGRPLTQNSVSNIGVEKFSDLLKEGHRAITIPMDEFNSTAGMLVAGDRIDLFLLAKKKLIQGRDSKDSTKALYMVLEDAVVLATGKSTVDDEVISGNEDFDEYNTVTLGVPLRDAGRIGLAREDGKFIAMLRNRDDDKKVKHRLIDTGDLYQNVATNDHHVEFIIGGKSKNGLAAAKEQRVEIEKLANKLSELQGLETAAVNQSGE